MASSLAIPIPPFSVYGRVKFNNLMLTKVNTDHIVTAQVDGQTLEFYQMGDRDTDNYILKIPLDSECSTMISAACEGDTFEIYVDGYPIEENPLIVGGMGETEELLITVVATGREPTLTTREQIKVVNSDATDTMEGKELNPEEDDPGVTITTGDDEEPLETGDEPPADDQEPETGDDTAPKGEEPAGTEDTSSTWWIWLLVIVVVIAIIVFVYMNIHKKPKHHQRQKQIWKKHK